MNMPSLVLDSLHRNWSEEPPRTHCEAGSVERSTADEVLRDLVGCVCPGG